MGMSDNVNLAWKMFDSLGYSDVMKSALLGNAMQESYSELRPTAFNKDENAFGIFQWRDTKGDGWNSPRITWLKEFAQERGLDPNEIQTQVLYTDWELKNKFKDTYDKLMRTNNIDDATSLVDSAYVYSAGSSLNKRKQNANQVFKNLKGIKGDLQFYDTDIKQDDYKDMTPNKEVSNNIDPNLIKASFNNEGNTMNNSNLGFPNSEFTGTKQTMIDKLKDPEYRKNLAGNIAVGLNSLRLEPDPELSSRMEAFEQRKLQGERANRTADILVGMGYPQIAEMVRNQDITGGQGLSFVTAKDKEGKLARDYEQAVKLGFKGTIKDFLTIRSGNNSENQFFKMDMKTLENYGDSIGDTRKQLDMLDALSDLNVKKGGFSGGGVELKMGLYNIANSFGIPISEKAKQELNNAQTFQSFANQLVLDMMGGSLGAGFSDADRSFVISMAPQLGNTIETNQMVMERMRQIIIRRQEVQEAMRNWLQTKGTLSGFNKHINEKYGYTADGKHQEGSQSVFDGKTNYVIKASINS